MLTTFFLPHDDHLLHNVSASSSRLDSLIVFAGILIFLAGIANRFRSVWLGDFLQRPASESRLLCGEQMNSKNDAELVHMA